jgi:hypothetical protein
LSFLPDLTDQDLEKIGIASLGHRRLLLRAIVELAGGEKKISKAAVETLESKFTRSRSCSTAAR